MALQDAFSRYADDLAGRLLARFLAWRVVNAANDNRPHPVEWR